MRLSEGRIGETYAVEEVRLAGSLTRRLEALGVNEQTKITVQNRKPGGPFIIKVRGTRLALGRKIADEIRIREV